MHLLSERNDFYLDWAIKRLGVAAAVTFGIWVPISYKITADGNAGNDEAQDSLISEISSMRAEAATAASAQRLVVTALARLQDQFDNIGLVAVILGSVFGGIVIIGLIVGVLAKRRKVRRIRKGTLT